MSALMDDDEARQDGGITPFELQAELDTLRSLRRRSISQPSDGIDPDLPPSPTSYSSNSSRDGTPPKSPTFSALALSGSGSASSSDNSLEQPVAGPSSGAGMGGRPRFPLTTLGEDASEEAIDEDTALAGPGAFGDNGISDLFWLPARLHPEIAPQEFRNFIKDQTKPENLMRRSGSMLGRKKSMLSRQYNPSDSEIDSSSESEGHALKKTPSRAGSFRRSTGLERLTLNDLQQLETLARQAAEEGQEGKEGERRLKHLVRRSLSLNPAALLGVAAENDQLPSLMSEDDDTQPFVHDTDSPLIVPPPGSILRRSARTKIRKNSLLGDGNGHRFGPSRRSRGSPLGGERQDDDESSETHGDRPVDMRKVSTSSQLSMLSLDASEGDHLGVQYEDRDARYRSPPASPEKAESQSTSPERFLNQISPPSTTAPLPMQYMPSIPPSPPSSREAGNEQPITLVGSVRTGADLPSANTSPSLSTSRFESASPPHTLSSDLPLLPPVQNGPQGSLRTTRKPGQAPGQPVPGSNTAQSPPQQSLLPKVTSPTSQISSSPIAAPSASSAKGRPDQLSLPQKLALEVQRSTAVQDRKVSPAAASLVGQQVQQGSTFVAPTNKSASIPQHSVSLEQRRQQEPPAIPLPAPQPQRQAPPASHNTPALSHSQPSKEKEKKSGWARLGLGRSNKDEVDTDDSSSIHSFSSSASSNKKGKKGKKEKELAPSTLPEKRTSGPTQVITPEKEKEKPETGGGFFGGLFGNKKKSEQTDVNSLTAPGARAAQQMHMPTPPPTASGMLTADGRYINFFRLPIHIERAVYRLSHIKLANPRRPLYEQVLISNLMFWYLGVINKPAGQPSQQQQQRNAEAAARAQAAKQANSVNSEGFRQATPAVVTPGSPPSVIPHAAPARPGLQRETSSPPPPPTEVRQRSQSNAETRPDAGYLTYPDTAQAQSRPLSHPPRLAHSAPSTLLEDQAPFSAAAISHPTTYPSSAHPPSSPSSVSLSPEDKVHQSSIYNRRHSDEAGFQVARPQRSASIQASQDTPAYPSSGNIQMRDKVTGQVLGTADFDERRKTTDLEALDIISAYADDEHRRSIGRSPEAYSAPYTYPTSATFNGSAPLKSLSPPTSPQGQETSQPYSQINGSYHQHAALFGNAHRSGPQSPPPTT